MKQLDFRKMILTGSLVLVSLLPFAFLPKGNTAETPTPEAASPRLLVHLLDYLAKDYSGAVSGGKVLSESEYSEQKEFSASALDTNSKLTELKASPQIATDLKQLNRLILGKADAIAVATLARSIQIQVIKLSGLEVAPTRWPSLKRGHQIFEKNCVSCHGQTGNGAGPAAASLTPKPANFLDSHMKEISPFQAFNTIRLGVPGTAMAPFHGLSDKEVWDAAFYVTSMRFTAPKQTPRRQNEWDADLLKKAATLSDSKLLAALSGKNEEDHQSLLAALRTHSDDDESGGNSLGIAKNQLGESLKDYKDGDTTSAKTKALKAYLEGVEPIEPRLKATDPNAVSTLEASMSKVRADIEARLDVAQVEKSVKAALNDISQAESILVNKAMSPSVAFLAAATILFREGFEAVLVIIALLGVIRAAGSRRAALWVHGGWISALGLGAMAWFFSGWLMGISGAQRETLEAVTSLFAVGVLLFVGFWLHSQTEVGRWKAFIHGKVQKALEGNKLWGLATISFVAVFREAFETVLFLRAIWLEGGEESRTAMSAGVFGSLALVIVTAWAILKYSAKLPIKKLFEASAIIMAGLAVILTGKGLHSLQETGILGVTSPPFSFHLDLLGLYPTWETLISQVAIFALIYGLWTFGNRPSSRNTPQASPSN